MYKKIIFASVGLLIAVSPLIVSAQTSGVGANLPSVPANATITQLEALIAELTQILQQLLQNRGSGTPVGHACPEYTFPACTSGTYIPGSTDSNGCTVPGHYMCAIAQPDSLTATDQNPVPYSIVAGGTMGVTVSAFTLQPSGENMNVQQMGLYLRGGQASPQDVTRAYVYQGSTLVGAVNFAGTTLSNNCPPANSSLGAPAGGCYFASTTVSSLALQQNMQTNFTVKADIASIGIAAPGTPGDHVVIGLSDAAASGVNSGTIVHSGYAPDLVGVRIFKSYPTVAQIPLQNTIGVNVGTPLIRFSVTASPNGTIGTLYQTFNVSPAGATLSNVQLSAYTDPSFSNPISQSKVGVIAPTLCQTGCNSISNTIVESTSPVEIPAGTTYYFQLSGVVSPISGVSQYSVATTLLGDSVYDFPQTSVTDHFVWSPNDNGTSQLATNDWTNGDAVAGLPMGGLTQTVTVTPPAVSSTVTYVSNSGGSVTGSYANLPTGSLIVAINVTSNQPAAGVSAAVSGSGTVTLNNIPAGTFYLKAQDSSGNYLAQSVTFTSAGPVTASAVTFSAWPNSGSVPLTTYFTISGATSASGYSVSFGDGSALGSNWQPDTETAGVFDLSHVYTFPGTYTVTLNSSGTAFKTATVVVSSPSANQNLGGSGGSSSSLTPNANLANALTALESALQGLEQWLGK